MSFFAIPPDTPARLRPRKLSVGSRNRRIPRRLSLLDILVELTWRFNRPVQHANSFTRLKQDEAYRIKN